MELELRALEFSLDIGISSSILEGDSEIVSIMLSLSCFFWLFDLGCQNSYKSFHSVSFSHVCGDRNSIAHNLTRHACHITDFLV